jgi:hypothetical protein
MTKYDLYDWYIENMVDESKGEIPLNFKEWEKEIYPEDMNFVKHLRSIK